MANVLMIDDEKEMSCLIGRLLTERGHRAESAVSGEAALVAVAERRPDLVLLDLHLGGIDGIETLRRLRRSIPGVPIVMLTAFGDVHTAVSAMKEGATDFLTKPFNNLALLDTVDRLLAMDRSSSPDGAPQLIGDSPALREALDSAVQFAVPDINILLLGETGTGKEVFARTIHAASKRRGGPFVAIDCSMLAESLIEAELFGHEKGSFTGASATRAGRLEMAQGGTLFLDEIGNLPLSFQAKLLRVLQERRLERVGGRDPIRLDVRVICATNANIKDAIVAGTFRQDLYYRLGEMTIDLPPLRDREGDVGILAEHFVGVYSTRFSKAVRGLTSEAIEILSAHDWPGNVRELENTMKRAVVLADTIVRAEHLPKEIRAAAARREAPVIAAAVKAQTPLLDAPDPVPDSQDRLRVELDLGISASTMDLKAFGAEAAEQAERSLLITLMRRSTTSCAQLAKMLGVDPKTLRGKLRKYRLEIS
jgi:DNA-binding NtrC family response regulator